MTSICPRWITITQDRISFPKEEDEDFDNMSPGYEDEDSEEEDDKEDDNEDHKATLGKSMSF